MLRRAVNQLLDQRTNKWIIGVCTYYPKALAKHCENDFGEKGKLAATQWMWGRDWHSRTELQFDSQKRTVRWSACTTHHMKDHPREMLTQTAFTTEHFLARSTGSSGYKQQSFWENFSNLCGRRYFQMLCRQKLLPNRIKQGTSQSMMKSYAVPLSRQLSTFQEASPPHNSDCGITYPQKLWEIVAATTGVIACEESHGLSFLSANWMPSYRSTATGCAVHRGVCDAVDVLDLVQLYCPNGIEICQLRPTKRKFGVNCSKTTPMRLVVTYACIRPNSPCGAVSA